MPLTTPHGTLDFARTEANAQAMTEAELHAALADIINTLPAADEQDRKAGTDRGGLYRDEASVYRIELAHRTAKADVVAKAKRAASRLLAEVYAPDTYTDREVNALALGVATGAGLTLGIDDRRAVDELTSYIRTIVGAYRIRASK